MIIRDVLDCQLVDKNGKKLGKVDGITVSMRKGKPPRIANLEVGPTVLAARLHPKFAGWVEKWLGRLGPRQSEPTRIPFSKVKEVGIDVVVDMAAEKEELPLLRWEYWLRDKIVCKIFGGE